MKQVIIRVDGGSGIGLGHIYRMLALAEMISSGFRILFAIAEEDETVQDIIARAGFKSIVVGEKAGSEEDLKTFTEQLIPSIIPDIVVLDGYHFREKYQLAVREKKCKLVCIDGLYKGHFHADAVINYNGYARAEPYSREANTKLYLGPDYCFLRKPFLELSRTIPEPVAESGEVLMVMFGGADPGNLTQKLLEMLADSGMMGNFRKVNVLLGAKYLYRKELTDLVHRESWQNITVLRDLESDDLISRLMESSLIVVPGGYSLYEICCVGVPVLTGYYVENQVMNANFANEAELGISVGDFNALGKDGFQSAVKMLLANRDMYIGNQKKLIDGAQQERLLNIMKDLWER
jgi:UDP-2,4-diacetamido-2,4,6-trideoxy-beta-L-altropyranose hydrolase